MKIILIIIVIALAAMPQKKCNSKKNNLPDNCYKGRLEVKGICSNYTIKLLEGKIDTTKIVASWTDESTGKAYQNVFALGSPCTFPSTVNEGDEFYFTLDSTIQNCPVCMAYYPHPSRSLKIKWLSNPCSSN